MLIVTKETIQQDLYILTWLSPIVTTWNTILAAKNFDIPCMFLFLKSPIRAVYKQKPFIESIKKYARYN